MPNSKVGKKESVPTRKVFDWETVRHNVGLFVRSVRRSHCRTVSESNTFLHLISFNGLGLGCISKLTTNQLKSTARVFI